MIHPPAAPACAKNIKGHHRVAVNLTFCVRAIGIKALINFLRLFLTDPGSPEVCTCVQEGACMGLMTEASDGKVFPSANSEKELGHEC